MQARPKFAYYSGSALPSRSANSVHVMKMCAALAATGADVALFALKGHEPLGEFRDIHEFYGVPHNFRIERTLFYNLRGWNWWIGFNAARQASRWGAHIHYGREIHSVYWAARRGHAISFEAHKPFDGTESRQCRLFKEIMRRRKLRHLIVITDKLRREFCKNFRLSTDCMLVLPDGADLPHPEWEEPRGRSSSHLRARVGYIGHLYAGKGMELLAKIAKELPDFDFEVAGGNEYDIAAWKARLAGTGNIRFHGFIPHAKTEPFRQSCDILIAPFLRNVASSGGGNISEWASPLKLFEYMGSRRPIVCSDLAVLREVMRDGHNSLLCNPDNVAAWIAALRRLKSDAALAQRLVNNAYEDLKNKYSWKRRAQKLMATLALEHSSRDSNDALWTRSFV